MKWAWQSMKNEIVLPHIICLGISFHKNTRQETNDCAGICLQFMIKVVGTTLLLAHLSKGFPFGVWGLKNTQAFKPEAIRDQVLAPPASWCTNVWKRA